MCLNMRMCVFECLSVCAFKRVCTRARVCMCLCVFESLSLSVLTRVCVRVSTFVGRFFSHPPGDAGCDEGGEERQRHQTQHRPTLPHHHGQSLATSAQSTQSHVITPPLSESDTYQYNGPFI